MGRGPVPGRRGLANGPQIDTRSFSFVSCIPYSTWIWYNFYINFV